MQCHYGILLDLIAQNFNLKIKDHIVLMVLFRNVKVLNGGSNTAATDI